MPTIITFRGIRIEIRTRDHEPIHVHAVRGTGKSAGHVKVHIDDLLLKEVRNFSTRELKEIIARVLRHEDEIRQKWAEIYE